MQRVCMSHAFLYAHVYVLIQRIQNLYITFRKNLIRLIGENKRLINVR